MSWILPLLKYWRTGGIVLLLMALLFSSWLARERGEARDKLAQELKNSTRTFTAQIRLYEQARIDREERDEFRTKQNKKINAAQNKPVEFDGALRAAYDSLRERQRTYTAR